MITTPINVCQLNSPIVIGRQMENNYRQFVFDCSGYGEPSSVTLVHQRSRDAAPYIVATESGSTITWTITNTDTAFSGEGLAEIRINFDNALAKTITFKTHTLKSITADTVIPSALQSWYDAMIDYIDEHAASPEQIEAAVEAYLEEHPIPAPVTSVNAKTGDVVLTASDVGAYAKPSGGIPKSDLASTVQASLGLADTALQSAPVTSVNTKTGAVTLTANDVGALPASYVAPVISVNGQTGNVTLDADDVGALPDTYTAPVTSVDGKTGTVTILPIGGTTGQVLAKKTGTNYDVEWQTVSGGGAVDSVNGQTGTVVLDASDVGALPDTTTAADLGAYVKPSTGIPKTDLASAVQTSLGKADTALQTAPVTSVNGATGAVVIANATTSAAGLMSATDKSHLDAVYADYSSALTALGVS